ncbi:MAG TPA: YbhB/YbcL family Raf kinase inhibitor-like protein [Dermatophilaceae bacterium]|nr:YbhB/YbcL family Raf kinase inhibitor-like protein [Dermatophilaceae bacterium]
MSVPQVITVKSAAFAEGEPIPSRFTCDGDGEAPPLSWEGVPGDAAALALVVDDPDAPKATFTHWVVLDIPAGTTTLEGRALPPGAVQATNSGGRSSYYPPCPPSGVHHYRFTVYALARPTGLPEGAGLNTALRAVESSATARGRLVGSYERRR